MWTSSAEFSATNEEAIVSSSLFEVDLNIVMKAASLIVIVVVASVMIGQPHQSEAFRRFYLPF